MAEVERQKVGQPVAGRHGTERLRTLLESHLEKAQ
jgi:hypothetical protein